MIKIYFPSEIYDSKSRGELFPLLKPFLKPVKYSDEQRIKDYGVSEKEFLLVETIEEANVLILPMSWNYYKNNSKSKEVVIFIEENRNKKILSFTSGDFGVETPEYDNLYILRQNGNKSKLSKNHIGMPVFIEDPIIKHFDMEKIPNIPFNKVPIIGFCGLSNYSKINAVKEYSRVVFRNILFVLKRSVFLPQEQISTSYLRGRVLNIIKKSKNLDDNFIERIKYRAGVKTEEDRKRTTLEFYNNIKDSQYIVSVRGAGNFSARVYEALAMGRIPIFINTDCLVPHRDEGLWKQHVVWVEKESLNDLEKGLVAFHHQLLKGSIEEFSKKNRMFWEQNLKISGYFKKLILDIL